MVSDRHPPACQDGLQQVIEPLTKLYMRYRRTPGQDASSVAKLPGLFNTAAFIAIPRTLTSKIHNTDRTLISGLPLPATRKASKPSAP